MKQKIMQNFTLKMLSLLVALVAWLIIINIEDLTISRTISGIPVEVINENAISEAGKCYVLDDTDSVKIRVRGPKSVIDKVRESDFKAIADLSKYSLIIHCGGCTLNEKEMKYRLKCANDNKIPMTNYGTLIAYMNGILERSIEVFGANKI